MSAGEVLRRARGDARLSQRELARRAGTSQPAIAAVESGRKQPSFQTLSRWVAAAGGELALVPAADVLLQRRGEELVHVLGLAQVLPYKPSRTLRYPRIPS